MRVPRFRPIFLTVLLLASPAAFADEPSPGPAPSPNGASEDLPLGVVEGDGVNLRVGPRMDNTPVAQLDDGAVVLVVEEVGSWLGVRVPVGFPVCVASQFVEADGPDHVKVTARRLNLRVHVPEEGRPQPGVFREQATRGDVYTLISRDKDWVWVMAPEDVRVYVNKEFVKVLGYGRDHRPLLDAARAKRADSVKKLVDARKAAAAVAAGLTLRQAIGETQERLYRLRLEAQNDRVPVLELAETLDAAIAAALGAPPGDLALAKVLREDLEREVAIRVARGDAEIARLRGLPSEKPVPTPAPVQAAVDVVGEIRWEPAPGWKDGGAFILYVGDVPKHVVRLGTGGDVPAPDLRQNADGKPRRILGSAPGERVFGLPVIDVKSVRAP
jgi:hypothetical protein